MNESRTNVEFRKSSLKMNNDFSHQGSHDSPAKPTAADSSPLDRPGVPHELSPPAPVGNAHWLVPDRQRSDRLPITGYGRPLTPVYSTAHPPRGLSGAIRRFAYSIPDYRPRRWMLLILADRIDVLEHNPRKLAKAVGGISALVAGVFAIRALRRL